LLLLIVALALGIADSDSDPVTVTVADSDPVTVTVADSDPVTVTVAGATMLEIVNFLQLLRLLIEAKNLALCKGKSTVDKNRIKVYKNIYTCIFIKYVYFLFSNNFL